MIYVIPISAYPKKRSLYIEKSNYIDLSNNSWTITRVYNGFFVRFWGDIPESYKIYACDYGLFKKANITNTGLLFVENDSFDTFCDMRDVIINNNTETIFDVFIHLLSLRLTLENSLLDCENY